MWRRSYKKNDILLKDYENNSFVDYSNIVCEICKKNAKCNAYILSFYRFISCKKNICPLCKIKHIEDNKCKANIIYYDEINYYC